MILPIGHGVYPDVHPDEVPNLLATLPAGGGAIALVMGVDGQKQHDVAAAFARAGVDVTRRRHVDDSQQIDWNLTPEQNADRWVGLILGGLAADQWKAIYRRAVGFNEVYSNGRPEQFAFLVAIEVLICQKLHALGIAYAWGSIATGNIDAGPFATVCAPILAIADATCYHFYCKPRNTTVEGENEPWWVWRPWLWFQECQKRGVRFPALFGGESGTFFSWKQQGQDEASYFTVAEQVSDVLSTLRGRGVPIIGHCPFAIGAVDKMGDAWNVGSAFLQLVGQHNRRGDLDRHVELNAWTPAPTPIPVRKPMQDFDSPNHGNVRHETRGVVVHSTRGGASSFAAEYQSTCDWFVNPASQVSAHAVVGPNGEIHRPVRPEVEAWHARSYNATHLGIEIVQPHHGDTIPDAAIDAAAKVVADWHKTFGFPLEWNVAEGLAEHYEIPPGIADGKTDIQAPFDRDDFLRRVTQYAGEGDELTDQQKAAVLDHLNILWGYTNAATIRQNPDESEKACHERIVALKTVLGLNG